MEGFTPGLVLALVVTVALAGVSLILALISIDFLLARRTRRSRISFAGAALALTAALTLALLTNWVHESNERFSTGIYAGSIAIAGAGQFIAAFRHPKSFPASLACYLGAVAFLVGPRFFEASGSPFLRGAIILVPIASLGMAGLTIAMRECEWPRSRRQMLAVPVLANLSAILLVLSCAETSDNHGTGGTSARNEILRQFLEIRTNTQWTPVFATIVALPILSAAFYSVWSVRRK